MRRLLCGCAVVLMAMGCVTVDAGPKPYEAQKVGVACTQAEIMAVIRDRIRENTWSLQTEDTSIGFIEAFSRETNDDGLITRQRWKFTVARGEVSVTMVVERKFSVNSHSWESTNLVCGEFQYFCEKQELEAIRAKLDGRGCKSP